eukprot:4009777-Pleurochrysis_carterae.AAC.4
MARRKPEMAACGAAWLARLRRVGRSAGRSAWRRNGWSCRGRLVSPAEAHSGPTRAEPANMRDSKDS